MFSTSEPRLVQRPDGPGLTMAFLLLPVGADGIRLGLVAAPDGGDRRVLGAAARTLLTRLDRTIAGRLLPPAGGALGPRHAGAAPIVRAAGRAHLTQARVVEPLPGLLAPPSPSSL